MDTLPVPPEEEEERPSSVEARYVDHPRLRLRLYRDASAREPSYVHVIVSGQASWLELDGEIRSGKEYPTDRVLTTPFGWDHFIYVPWVAYLREDQMRWEVKAPCSPVLIRPAIQALVLLHGQNIRLAVDFIDYRGNPITKRPLP